jgi:acetyl-CoA carboxylase, biotin carboxylase subunit
VFRRVLIANRGEGAVRIVRACRELGVESVAVYSTADRDSLHVSLADQAVQIGPPPAALSYLNIPSLVAAATTTGCEAVHPGWGFLAENAEFARSCEDNELVFVGPRPETIETMGDKVQAKEAMRAAGLPLVPGSDGEATLAEAKALAGEIGFPLLLKASAGGGGKGMRLVASAEDLESSFRTASAEAETNFGEGGLYVERALVDARHVEIQVLGDGEGAVLTLGERDCSIQRRHQKLVEEAPSPAVSPDVREAMEDAARRACETLRYRGAGTIEFLLTERGFFFIEMKLRGHAFEFRINAEDPARDFMPSPGRVTRFRPPLGPGVRVDTHVVEGYAIPPFYDSLVAKVIVWAEDRQAALGRARRALSEFELEGVATTRDLALDIVQNDDFVSGDYTTAFIQKAASSLSTLGPIPA